MLSKNLLAPPRSALRRSRGGRQTGRPSTGGGTLRTGQERRTFRGGARRILDRLWPD